MEKFEIFTPMGLNPKGRRNITEKEKEEIKEEWRKKTGKKTHSKKLEIDHKKPVALHKKSLPILDLMNHFRLDINTNSGKPKKHSYDWKSNLQPLTKKQHKKKTKEDMKKIKEKRRKEWNQLGVSYSRNEIIGDSPF